MMIFCFVLHMGICAEPEPKKDVTKTPVVTVQPKKVIKK